jgi:hypothetical protein
MTAAPDGLRVAGHDRTQLARTTELLRLLLRDSGSVDFARVRRLIELTTPDVVLAVARYHGVSGLISPALRRLDGVPEMLPGELRADFDSSVHRHLQSTWELSRLKATLDPTGVPWVVIKGPAAVELLYGGQGGRLYQDLDILVDPSGFREVLAALEASGLRQLDRNWAVLRRDMRGEVHYGGATRLEIDLHWNLVNMYRGRMRISTRELLGRAVDVRLAGVAVRTLDPTDSLIHLCVHAAISGGDRILWLKDIERAIAVRPPAWDELVARSRRWHVAAPVGLMLARSARFLGAGVPDRTVSDLVGPAAMGLIRGIDRLFPWQRALGRLTSPNRLMARSIGQGPIGAPVWLVVRSIRNLDRGQEQASSAFTPGGDDRDRAAFIASVMASEPD